MRDNVGKYRKAMLKEYKKRVLDAFILSDKAGEFRLPAVSSVPFIGAAPREDVYVKTSVSPESSLTSARHCINFIGKKKTYGLPSLQLKMTLPYAFTWSTNAKKLRKGVRWGIVSAESVTAKAIAALGNYRVIANERALKGLVSNADRAKIAIIGHYQDKFEALHEIESLVNKNDIKNLKSNYKVVFESYIKKLRLIQRDIKVDKVGKAVAKQLRSDIESDIRRVKSYYDKIWRADQRKDEEALKKFNRARGNDSVMEFVKRQMIHHSYAGQGINEDNSFLNGALTRGELSDFFEEVRWVIDNHRADLRSTVEPAHHGIFGNNDERKVYNFKNDKLSPERQKLVIGAISRIEGWDKVKYNEKGEPEFHVIDTQSVINAQTNVVAGTELDAGDEVVVASLMRVGPKTKENEAYIRKCIADSKLKHGLHKTSAQQNENTKRPLTVTSSPNYRSSANFSTFLKKVGMLFWTMLQSVLVRTQSWDENPWPELDDSGSYIFRPHASRIRKSSYLKTYKKSDPWYTKIRKSITGAGADYKGAEAKSPLWFKPMDFFETIGQIFRDIAYGFWDFGKSLVHNLPNNIRYNHRTALALSDLKWLQQKAENQIKAINDDFAVCLDETNELIRSTKPESKSYLGQPQAFDQDTFARYSVNDADKYKSDATYALAPFHLRYGNNDPLCAGVLGATAFVDYFTQAFGKNPIGALAFATGYTLVGGSFMLPKTFSFLGTAFETWVNNFGLTLASGGPSSAIASAALAGQFLMGTTDLIMRGPQSDPVKMLSFVLDDPLTIAAGIGGAWLAGRVLTVTIPVLAEDLGRVKSLGELTFGGKGLVLLMEAFHEAEQNPGKTIKFVSDGRELDICVNEMSPEQKKQVERVRFAAWLTQHENRLPMLPDDERYELARHIDAMYEREEAEALKKKIFPEKEHSIFYQLIFKPLSYLPVLLVELPAAIISSMMTRSLEPLKSSGRAFGKKIREDLVSLLISAEAIVSLLGKCISIIFKVPVFVVDMCICRVASIFGARTAHATHQVWSAFHVAWRMLGESLYENLFFGRAIKSAAEEHHCSVSRRYQSTHQALLAEWDVEPTEESATKSSPVASSASGGESSPVASSALGGKSSPVAFFAPGEVTSNSAPTHPAMDATSSALVPNFSQSTQQSFLS